MPFKAMWLGILWSSLLLVGVPLYIEAYNSEDLNFWVSLLAELPLSAWSMWTFLMLYDVWILARQNIKRNSVKELD